MYGKWVSLCLEFSLYLQLAELDAETKEMLQMLHNTCVEQTGVDEGKYECL
jgi:hypothetical protein